MDLKVKNKRMKMSPNGVITLPVSARKALGMKINEGSEVSVKVEKNKVILSGKAGKGDKTWRISKKGIMELKEEAKALLEKSKGRHYWLELDDKKKQASLSIY
ncbi:MULTISPECIES: AbrB/MazE/SpoVT family DNA-binding domain-containing protein [Aquimarina]|uniref:AbrB/MazE/SpoVT family DNA-binding domain-containing protein n=1 Tax=Aquimarina TaxID=290174 RepID=UPI000CDE6884|nr:MULTISPECIES: AbrB/MazE/SpoVT family DNA-binding domain-containing protein [Aquimarina]